MNAKAIHRNASDDLHHAYGWLLRAPLAVLLAASILWAGSPMQAARIESKPEVEAAYIYKFAAFVEWPAGTFPRPDSPIVIGVLGNDAFLQTLQSTIQGKSMNGRPVLVKRVNSPGEAKSCQIVVLGGSTAAEVREALRTMTGAPVLTIAEIDHFASSGGIINFILQGGKVRFEINPDTARKNGLKISSELLVVSKVVNANS